MENINRALRDDPFPNKIIPAVVVYLFNKDKEVLLFRRNKPPFRGYWEPVGGKIEFGERCRDAAIREVKEETGIKILKNKLKFVKVHDHIFGKVYHRILIVFAAQIKNNPKINLSEHSEYGWFSINRLPTLIPDHPKLIQLSFSKIFM